MFVSIRSYHDLNQIEAFKGESKISRKISQMEEDKSWGQALLAAASITTLLVLAILFIISYCTSGNSNYLPVEIMGGGTGSIFIASLIGGGALTAVKYWQLHRQRSAKELKEALQEEINEIKEKENKTSKLRFQPICETFASKPLSNNIFTSLKIIIALSLSCLGGGNLIPVVMKNLQNPELESDEIELSAIKTENQAESIFPAASTSNKTLPLAVRQATLEALMNSIKDS